MLLIAVIILDVFSLHHLQTNFHQQQHTLILHKQVQDKIEKQNLSSVLNLLYFINISFGTPPQQFPILVDTGSVVYHDLNKTTWISNTTCDGCLFPRFNPNESITLQEVNENHQINYNIGSLDGKIVQDFVSFQHTTLNVSMKFMLADTFQLPGAKFQGLFGLSSYNDRQNIFELGYQQKQLETQLFGLILKQNPQQSLLIYNNFSSEFLEEVTWMPNVLNHQWSMKILGMYVNERDVTHLIVSENGTVGLMDSGSSCLWLDENIVDFIMTRYINNICRDNLTCPCHSPNYPIIRLYLSGVIISINSENYMIQSNDQYCRPCISRAGKLSHGYQILGDPAMQTIRAIFDKEKQLFGVHLGNNIHNLFYFQLFESGSLVIIILCIFIFSYQLIKMQ